MADQNVLINVDLQTDADVEFGTVPAGEYLARVEKAIFKEGTRDDGSQWQGLSLVLDLANEESAQTAFTMIWVPTGGGTPKQNAKAESDWRKACYALGVDPAGGWTPNDLKGREFYGYFNEQETQERGKENVLQRFIGPA